MTTTTTNTYEGLFLLPQSAGSDLGTAADLVKSLLEKVGAEIIAFRKWDERRLAYEIKGNKRGLYFLCYFNYLDTLVNDGNNSSYSCLVLVNQCFCRGNQPWYCGSISWCSHST